MSRASSPNTATEILEDFLDALATRIAAKIASAHHTTAGAGEVYTSKATPPGMSAKRFNELCRQRAAGGDSSVRKIGRVWHARADVFVQQARRAASKTAPAIPWSPEAAFESVGVRPTR